MVRAVVLTSTFLRHRYFINHLARHLDVVGVWEEKDPFPLCEAARNA